MPPRTEEPGPIWPGSAGTPRSLWQRATSCFCLRVRFHWESAFPAEQILLQPRGDFDSPTIFSEVTFSHFYGFKSRLQSRSLSSTKCNLALFPTCQRARAGRLAQQGHQPCAPAAVAQLFQAPSLPLQHLELAASWSSPLMETEVKHVASAVNWACRLEPTRGHVRAARGQFGLSQCSGSRQAARKIKVRRPIRDSAWHILLSTRINSTWNTSHYLAMDCLAALLPPTVLLPLDYLHVTHNKKHHAFLLIV